MFAQNNDLLITSIGELNDCRSNTYCVDFYIESESGVEHEFGISSYYFEFNAAALKPIHFQTYEFDGEEPCLGEGLPAIYSSSYAINTGDFGDSSGVIAVTFVNNLNIGCPTVGEEPIHFAQACFDVVDADFGHGMSFNDDATTFVNAADESDWYTNSYVYDFGPLECRAMEPLQPSAISLPGRKN